MAGQKEERRKGPFLHGQRKERRRRRGGGEFGMMGEKGEEKVLPFLLVFRENSVAPPGGWKESQDGRSLIMQS